MTPALLSLSVIAALALIGVGAVTIVRRRRDRLRSWLMVGAGAVVLVNVWLYALPG